MSPIYAAMLGHFSMSDFFSICNKTLKLNSKNWKTKKKKFYRIGYSGEKLVHVHTSTFSICCPKSITHSPLKPNNHLIQTNETAKLFLLVNLTFLTRERNKLTFKAYLCIKYTLFVQRFDLKMSLL